LHTRKWTDQNNQDRYVTEVRAITFQSLDSLPQANPV
ncbi:single-stranded DNA-binding protein, partial [Acinetobacter baumannii]